MKNTMRKNKGFSLVDILIALVIYSTVVSGVVSYLMTNKRVNRQIDISSSMEANLRIGMDRIVSVMRNGGYGIPNENLNLWIPWVSGFTTSPIKITQGASASDPDSLSVATCTDNPVLTISAGAVIGNTLINVDDVSSIDTANKRLISFDESDFAHITTKNTSTMVIDTDPATAGDQGLLKSYPSGTKVCRVDVTSLDVDTTNNKLRWNKNHGAGLVRLVDEIENLQIVTLSAGSQYQLTLTARSNRRDPGTGNFPTRNLTTTVTLKN